MSQQQVILDAQWFFFFYFLLLNSGYLLLNVLAFFSLGDYLESRDVGILPQMYSELELPVSVLVPAFNEALTIEESVRSLLQLRYSEFEVIVINDGSTDDTLQVLQQAFALKEIPEAYRVRLNTRPVRAIYRSLHHPNLRVIDKENGGKADALNVGINDARYPLFCGVDADSMLHPDSLRLLVRAFLEEPRTVACGGTVRIANGCDIKGGVLQRTGLPTNPLALFQIVEYLRAFLFGRLGWVPFNALLIISGAFGLFHKETVVRAGGYSTGTVGEDMELVVRLHRTLRRERRPYRITFVPDPVCWTNAPEELRTLKNQRVRWQRGLSESLSRNWSLMFSRHGGSPGWFAFPFMVFFEWWGPVFEIGGYVFMVYAFLWNILDPTALVAFLLVAIGMGVLLSTSSLLLEERSFHIYPKGGQTLVLFGMGVLENFGYRQLMTFFRLYGLLLSLFGVKSRWGRMRRRALG